MAAFADPLLDIQAFVPQMAVGIAEDVRGVLPREVRDWTFGADRSFGEENGNNDLLLAELDWLSANHAWQWPDRPVFFLSDLHADRDAFVASLMASGGIRKTGFAALDFDLTETGRQAEFIIGGDCFDKGPSNLDLLQAIRRLIDLGARVQILAGNHDLRTFVGMQAAGGDSDHRNDHFFLRLGPKAVPLLREIWERYLEGGDGLTDVPDADACRDYLYPGPDWFDAFPAAARGNLARAKLKREIKRIRKKLKSFEPACAEAGLCIRKVYAAVRKWRDLFVVPGGEFTWYFERMQLCHRAGSFMFLHAGLDDVMAQTLHDHGADEVNRQFREALDGQPFDLYYGPVANTVRTKYRNVDHVLSPAGGHLLRQCGIHAIVHGHRNLLHGQRLMLRRGLINFECDATVDAHSRRKEGLSGPGAAVTVIRPEGHVLGISTDFPYIKAFEPTRTKAALRSLLGY